METIETKIVEYKFPKFKETRWKGNGKVRKEEYSLYRSGENTDKQFRGAVIGFKPVNGRIRKI